LRARGWRYGGENSGHLLCLDKHTTGDGIVSALQVLAALVRHETTLAKWTESLCFYPQRLKNVAWPHGVDWLHQALLVAAVREAEAELAGQGRILLRPSGTEPLLRIMVEGGDEELVTRLVDRLARAAEEVVRAQ
jgi:phosphoglucosamine mutase